MAQQRKLLDQVRDKIRLKQYSYRTEKSYLLWIRQYILFHGNRHPKEMGHVEVEAFLQYLAVERDVAPSTQNQALSALLVLYREVLNQPLSWMDIPWAQKPNHLPVVLSRLEVQAVPRYSAGATLLIGQLFYGSGLPVYECLRCR